MKIIKKDGRLETFSFEKIKNAVSKSAARIQYNISEDEWMRIETKIKKSLVDQMSVADLHTLVEKVLFDVIPLVGQSYANYRNYKKDYAQMMEDTLKTADDLNYHADRSNANTTAGLISTKRSLIYTAFNKNLYKKVFLSKDECQVIKDGYIYIHDLGARMDTYNCSLFDMGRVLQGGFEWEHIGYNEPKDVRTACNLISDITLNCAAQQYGGFTVPEIDSILAPYAEKSYKHYYQEYINICNDCSIISNDDISEKAHNYAWSHTERDICQGFQGFEHTFNTVASSRGDYPFVTMTGGCEENKFGQLVWHCALKVRREGQGHPGKKRPAIFPKLVFIYTKKLHSKGEKMYNLFLEGVQTSAVAMYPDWLSMDQPVGAKSTVGDIFNKYHKFGVSRWLLDQNNNVYENPEWVDSIISPMGKRKLQLI